MSEVLYERLKENLEALKMRNTLEINDNYLERAIKDELNIVDVLHHIFTEEALRKRRRAYEKQVQMSGFPNDTHRGKPRCIVRIPPCGAAGNNVSAPRGGELNPPCH